MSDGWKGFDEVEDDEEYFSETLDGAELTGDEPRFKAIESMKPGAPDLHTMKVDDLIATYIQARNQLATDRKGYKAREAAVKTHMSIISMVLRERGDQLGVESFRTPLGTAYRNFKESWRVANWDELVAYVKTSGNFNVLQKRVSPNAVKEIRELEGKEPPGLEYRPEVEFAVRAPTSSRKSK